LLTFETAPLFCEHPVYVDVYPLTHTSGPKHIFKP
jgi:hypothetical protein